MSNEKISVFKMSNGEEVIAFSEKKAQTYKLRKPHVLVNDAQSVALMPWCIINADEIVSVHERNIVFVGDVLNSLKNEYIRIVTDIELPSPVIDSDVSDGKILLTE